MSWVTVIWAMLIGACAAIALPYLLVGIWQRRAADLFFVGVAAGTIGLAAGELGMMHATSAEEYGVMQRWLGPPIFLLVISMVGFVRLYFGTGRLWLGITTCAVRLVCLIMNFVSPVNLTFTKMTGLVHVPFLGDTVSLGTGVVSPWVHLAELSSLLMVAFVADASISLWKKGKPGDRRRTFTVGGSIVFFVLVAQLTVVLFRLEFTSSPYPVSLWFFPIVATMALELGYDLIRAAELTRQLQANEAELRETQRRMDLAARATDLGIWVWDIVRDEIWVSEKERALFGFAPSEKPAIDRFRNAIHPDDRASMRKALEKSLNTGMEYEAEHRVLLPNGQIRWLATRGRVEFGGDGKPAQMRGVSFDVTQRKLGEDALRESEQRFRVVADAAPVLIWMSDVDKLCTFFNKPWLEFTGRRLEQELGNGWAEGVHPDDLQRCLKTYVEAFDAHEPFVMQYRLRRHDGEYRWISDSGVPLYDANRNFTGYIGSCIDVTELLKKEEALREFEERVTLAAKAAHLGVWELDTATNEVWMSGSARALFGFDSEARVNRAAIQERVHPEDRAHRDAAVKEAIETQGGYKIEYRILLPNGTVHWISGRGRCVSRQDKGIRLIGVSMDITPQKQTQELFRLATEASPSGLVLVSDQGRIVLVNSHVEELFGYRRDELIGKAVEVLVPERFASAHPAHRSQFLAAPTARAMGAGRELFARRKDGSEFPVEIGLSPIKTPEGTLVLAAVVDISARKLAEAEARQHREELGHLSRVAVMGELAASIAHELNQPLAGIISNARAGQRFIDRGDVDLGELRDLLNDIVADGRRAGDVIRGVQGMVKKVSPVRQRVNLNELVTNVMQIIKSDAVVRSCELKTLLARNLPAIDADPTQLQQVLLNLVLNAFDAMRNTPLSRRQLLIATERNGDGSIGVSVRDYGTGISEEVRDRLFEPFFTTKTEGLGMGLAIVRSIVESHAGTIAAENVEGGGTRFRVLFPTTASAS